MVSKSPAHQACTPSVHLRDAVCLLGGFPALAGADLDVAPGEIVLLEGPNGAGKSTLLRLCAGLVAVASGTVEVLGADLTTDRRAVRRRVGLLGHSGALYDELTVADNLRFVAGAARAPLGAWESAMGRMELDGRLAGVAVGRLSAGQRRRVALAAVLARSPELWLLDEPHAGFDAAGRDLVDELMVAAAAGGATVMFASHEHDRARAVARRRVLVAGGRIHGDRTAPPGKMGRVGVEDVAGVP